MDNNLLSKSAEQSAALLKGSGRQTWLSCLLGLWFCSAAVAQSPAGALQGTVLDPSNGAVVGAHITVIPAGRTAGQTTTSNSEGQFTLTLEPGTYTVRISAKDFLESVQSIDFLTGPQARTFALHLAGLRETIEVKADAPGYDVSAISTATKTLTPLREVPQSITVVTQELMKDQAMMSVADVVRYVPGITVHQGENNRDDLVIRGNRSSADFFVNGVRDDVQYYRDLYNLDRVEALKGPNAMIFGRGGGGGVLNRVTKEALFNPMRSFTFQGGSFGNKRLTADYNEPLNDKMAMRFNAIYEDSDSFRNGVGLERGGVNPTFTFTPGSRTKITTGYEYLRDTRIADRGITSYQGRAASVDPATFYGNPNDSHVRAAVHLGTISFEHRLGQVMVRNRAMYGDYDRFYQNYVPGATSADRSTVTLTVYNNATHRKNTFNQTDLVTSLSTGPLKHTLVGGTEVGRQLTRNLRNTGFFNDTSTSLAVPFAETEIATPVTYRQSATDANNRVQTSVAAAFAQDQVEISRYVQVIGGIRVDRFDLKFHNNRNDDNLRRTDRLVSPRAGIVMKPRATLAVYTSYSVSYLPSAGDQFSSLTTITQQVEPEKFQNYEVGIKWDVTPDLLITTAGFRLDRKNTRSTDPNDPTRIVQTGSQRTNGVEAGATGRISSRWQLSGGYSYQDAFVTSATTAAAAGAQVGQAPRHTVSLWNNYRLHPKASVALGLIGRSAMFATIDNSVVLPGYFRADAALYVNLTEDIRLQWNLENALNRRYLANADSNTNISPGSPRAIRMGLITNF